MTKTDTLLSLILKDHGFGVRVRAQHERHVLYGPADTCWEWTAQIDRYGYGIQQLTAGSLRSPVKAHRIAYALHNKAMPPEDRPLVCHTCDNPRCVNPLHLYAGSNTHNMRDRLERGRFYQGSAHAPETRELRRQRQIVTGSTSAHLSEEDVRAIRASPLTQKALGERYGVCQAHIWRIKHGKAWAPTG